LLGAADRAIWTRAQEDGLAIVTKHEDLEHEEAAFLALA
jgi:predicted nuclease of predicted toxin-antitoxin system